MEKRGYPIGFTVKQINNIYEKDLNENLKQLGITASQCAVLDFCFILIKKRSTSGTWSAGLV